MNQNRNSVDRDDREAISNQQAQLLNHPKILEKFAAVLTNKQSKSSIKESNTIKNKDNQIKDLESVLAVYDNYKMYLLFGYPQEPLDNYDKTWKNHKFLKQVWVNCYNELREKLDRSSAQSKCTNTNIDGYFNVVLNLLPKYREKFPIELNLTQWL